MCGLPVDCSLPLPAFIFSHVKPSVVIHKPLVYSVSGINLMVNTDKNREKSKKYNQTQTPWSGDSFFFFNGSCMCIFIWEKNTRGACIVFNLGFGLNLLCLKLIFAESRHNIMIINCLCENMQGVSVHKSCRPNVLLLKLVLFWFHWTKSCMHFIQPNFSVGKSLRSLTH